MQPPEHGRQHAVGQMQPGAESQRQPRIARNRQPEAARPAQPREPRRQCLATGCGVVTQDDNASTWKCGGGRDGVAAPARIGHKDQPREPTRPAPQTPRRSDQPLRHAMSERTTIADALATVRSRIAEACARAGRDPSSVTLVAVSKTHERAAIEAAIAAGQKVFGENRVQEAEAKYTALKSAHRSLKLHLIGPLQTNKAAAAVALFDVIETLDRPRLAEVIAREIARQKRKPGLFIQVNTGEEPQKAGIPKPEADEFIRLCLDEWDLPVRGLMCIPPVDEDPAPHFAWLAACAARHGLRQLSMGMSGDFEAAIAHGATHVRIGTAIFGARPARAQG